MAKKNPALFMPVKVSRHTSGPVGHNVVFQVLGGCGRAGGNCVIRQDSRRGLWTSENL